MASRHLHSMCMDTSMEWNEFSIVIVYVLKKKKVQLNEIFIYSKSQYFVNKFPLYFLFCKVLL